MTAIDLNLLVALDALLDERSVTAAAHRLGLSVSATSRALARLRSATGDPLLVQSGRDLVATPYAERLRQRVGPLLREVRDVLSPSADAFDPAQLERDILIRANEGFLSVFAGSIITAIRTGAPSAQLRFLSRRDKLAETVRHGGVDLEIGTGAFSARELIGRALFRDRFVAAARSAHPLFDAPITAERYAACEHVVASRRGRSFGPVDAALDTLGLARRVAVVMPGFPDVLTAARCSDLVALVPGLCLRTPHDAAGLRAFALPVDTPELVVSMLWHPRLDDDPAHRWLRGTVFRACRFNPAAVLSPDGSASASDRASPPLCG